MIRRMACAKPRKGGCSRAHIIAFGLHQGLTVGRRGGCRGVIGKRRQYSKFKERDAYVSYKSWKREKIRSETWEG